MKAVLLRLADLLSRLLISPIFWIFFLIALVLLFLIRSYIRLKLAALENLSYERSFSTDGIFVGDTLEMTEIISNPGWLPLVNVKMEFFMPSGLTVDDIVCKEYRKLTSVFYIPPYSTVKRVHVVQANRRDHYRLQNAVVIYRKHEFLFSSALDFYAYPDLSDVDARLSPDLYHAGNAISDQKYIEDPFFIAGIRPYMAGDPMRSINFKASVRSFSGGVRQLMCNHYDSSRNYDSMIVLDLASYPDAGIDGEEQVEVGLQYACYLLCQALKNSGRVGFAANCAVGSANYIHIPCSAGEYHTKHILKRFAEISCFGARNYSMVKVLGTLLPELPVGTDLYLVTPFVDEKTSNLLQYATHQGRNVRVIPLRTRRFV